MNTDQVKAVLTALLNAVQDGEVALPNSVALKDLESGVRYILGHPLALEIAAVAFTSAEGLLTFVLGRFGIPLSAIQALLTRAGVSA